MVDNEETVHGLLRLSSWKLVGDQGGVRVKSLLEAQALPCPPFSALWDSKVEIQTRDESWVGGGVSGTSRTSSWPSTAVCRVLRLEAEWPSLAYTPYPHPPNLVPSYFSGLIWRIPPCSPLDPGRQISPQGDAGAPKATMLSAQKPGFHSLHLTAHRLVLGRITTD